MAEQDAQGPMRKVRVHKVAKAASDVGTSSSAALNAAMDRKIAQLVPGKDNKSCDADRDAMRP